MPLASNIFHDYSIFFSCHTVQCSCKAKGCHMLYSFNLLLHPFANPLGMNLKCMWILPSVPINKQFTWLFTYVSCPTVCSQSKRMTDFILLQPIASGCILCKFIPFKPEGQVNLAIGTHKQIIYVTVYHCKTSHSVLAKQKMTDFMLLPATGCILCIFCKL